MDQLDPRLKYGEPAVCCGKKMKRKSEYEEGIAGVTIYLIEYCEDCGRKKILDSSYVSAF